MILTKDIASKILQKNLSELILLASQPIPSNNTSQFQTSSCKIKIPEGIEVVEAVSENVSSYRKSGKLIVTDGRNLVFFPTNEEHNFTDFNTKRLRASDPEDRKIIRRLIERALEISIKRTTGKKMMHGIFLLEDPIPLYRCEKAKSIRWIFGSSKSDRERRRTSRSRNRIYTTSIRKGKHSGLC